MDMALASIVEVMASTKFVIRRSAYLAAVLAFSKDTEIALLTTNIFKKDFMSGNPYEAGTALSCLSTIVTWDMAGALIDDMLLLLSSSKPYLRKKVVLALFRVFEIFPQGLVGAFSKLRDLLSDPDQSVLTATVNTLLEIAIRNPRNVLPLLPQLFHLLTNSSNNWMLIKLLKIFQALASIEPRLGPKSAPALLSLLNSTKAKSVECEVLRTVAVFEKCCGSFGTDSELSKEVFKHIRNLMQSTDNNLKGLSLEILAKFKHEEFFAHQGALELLLQCVEDADSTVRGNALRSLSQVIGKENFQTVAANLLSSARQPSKELFAADYIQAILFEGERNNFSAISDFAWYFLLLLDIGRQSISTAVLNIIAAQIRSIILKVEKVREYAFSVCFTLIASKEFTPSSFSCAVAWVVGELAGCYLTQSNEELEVLQNLILLAESASLDESGGVLWNAASLVLAVAEKSTNFQVVNLEWRLSLKKLRNSRNCALAGISFILTSLIPEDREGVISVNREFFIISNLNSRLEESIAPPEDLNIPLIALPEEYDFTTERQSSKRKIFIDDELAVTETSDLLKAFRSKLPKNIDYAVA